MSGYITVRKYASFEYEDRKSVFIGEAAPVSTEEDAIRFIEAVKKKYPDASHHVYAYVLRENSIMRYSDDREPQGTAGMPVLDVIRKGQCTDVVIVVTRYFGGTLLGTGGLVRAYTSAAAGAVKEAEIITYDLFSEVEVNSSYSDYQRIGNVFTELDFCTLDTRFTDAVTLTGMIRSVSVNTLIDNLTHISGGRIKCKILGEKYDFIKK